MCDKTKPYYEILSSSELFRGLSTSELSLVYTESNPWIQNFKKGAQLCSQGDLFPYIDILEKGVFISKKYHIDGKIQIVSAFTPPEIVNLEAPASHKKTSPVFVVACTDCRIIRINYEKLTCNEKLPERVRLIIFANIAAYLAADSVKYMDKSDVLSKRKVRDRIITFLNMLRNQTNRDVVDIGMSQEEFAQYLCVDRTSLSEALNDLRREEMIDYKNSKYTLLFPASENWI